MGPKISVYILAYNEELKIADAIKSVSWADEIILVDSYSTDSTVEIASKLGAKIIQVPFKGFGFLRNRGISVCSFEWILSLDSDERCTKEAKAEIQEIINSKNALDAYYIPRRNYFMGKWIKYSGFYPDYRQPQLFRKGVLEFKDDPVHEGYVIKSQKPVGYLKNFFIQIPYLDLSQVISKINRYSSLGAVKLKDKGIKPSMWTALSHALWAFFHIFFIKRGFLDGWQGFIISLGNFEETFYKYAKYYEAALDLAIRPRKDTDKLV